MSSSSLRCLLFLWLLCATACRERIQHGLDERQANELQSVLIERGLDARKVPEAGKKPSWAIEVTGDQSSDAVRVLAELGLPRPAAEVGCDVFGGSGLVRTPVEEGVCRVRVLERGLEKTLQSVEGVLLARVHLVVPPAPRPGQTAVPSKASAMLRVTPGSAARVRQSSDVLKALLAGGVEGLSSDAVSLLVDEVPARVEVASAGGLSSLSRLRVLLAVLGVLVTGLSGALVWATLRMRHYRERSVVPAAPPVPARPVLSAGAARKVA
ncbi:flagellar M-ring protein FliF [Myxococcus sp. CA051A]|uniref:flagellar M-ring protein FliF n=1 Tax=unclassified Myxococcus TaxID=2648731 RepID=UPI00157B48E2|nr:MULTISPECIES: flagellar M-ring protein FliF [unclassified Myxococcus]NTX33592.1 flagellar M-ring protein FliF [Myxococcus sp. CA033]NTX59301.1 flagellar M-ring protein FliF [Myxococcus sp. CA051A]